MLLVVYVMGCMNVTGVFFFSSRRRHTRSDRDWSSDVCSSDLEELRASVEELHQGPWAVLGLEAVVLLDAHPGQLSPLPGQLVPAPGQLLFTVQQYVARHEPFLARSDLVLGHCVASIVSVR